MADRPRFLARHSELGYTDKPRLALAGEPEAVDEETQRQQTRAALRSDDQRRQHRWIETRLRFEAVLGELRFFPGVIEEERSLRRTLDRLDRKLGG